MKPRGVGFGRFASLRVATILHFLESPVRGGDAGYAVVLDKSGHQKVRSEFFLSSVQGLAWSPKGNEVWFGATRDQDEANEVHALSLSGKHRVLMRVPGILRLHDVSPDGRLLISRETWRGTLLVRSLGETAERDLSWLDYSYASDLSSDGGNLAFFEWGEAARTSAIAYTRKLDGTPPVKLGDGAFPAFSPDRKWVVAITPPGVADRIFLLPTGPGESKTLPAYNLKRYAAPGWMPDGQQIIFVGNDERSWRIYAQDLAGGRPRPLTPEILAEPERFEAHLVSPDGRYVFARDLDGKPWLYPLNGGDRVGAAGIDRDDVWIGWSANTRSAYVFHWGEIPVTVFRVDLSTGKKEPIAQLAPRDPTGLSVILTQRVTPDGKSYAYSYERIFSELYLVSGVK